MTTGSDPEGLSARRNTLATERLTAIGTILVALGTVFAACAAVVSVYVGHKALQLQKVTTNLQAASAEQTTQLLARGFAERVMLDEFRPKQIAIDNFNFAPLAGLWLLTNIHYSGVGAADSFNPVLLGLSWQHDWHLDAMRPCNYEYIDYSAHLLPGAASADQVYLLFKDPSGRWWLLMGSGTLYQADLSPTAVRIADQASNFPAQPTRSYQNNFGCSPSYP